MRLPSFIIFHLFLHFVAIANLVSCPSLAVSNFKKFPVANIPQDANLQSLIYVNTAIFGPVLVSMAIDMQQWPKNVDFEE